MPTQHGRALCEFIDASPTAFHAVDSAEAMLKAWGGQRLSEKEVWDLQPQQLYYLVRDDASLIAFRLGTAPLATAGFLLAGAHTDAPGLRARIDKAVAAKGLERVAVEVYGGPINATWLDRPLSLAGRVLLQAAAGRVVSRLVNFSRPLAIIPNLAIHLNRDLNKGFEYPMHTAMLPLVAANGAAPAGEGVQGSWLLSALARELAVDPAAILSAELTFYEAAPSVIFGEHDELLAASRIDNLEGCHAILSAFCACRATAHTQVAVLFDNEEIGSTSTRGANSALLRDVLERIVLAQASTAQDFYRAAASSLLLSVDGAQAFHPGYADKFDPDYAPVLNKGPAIKLNANIRYATEAKGEAYIRSLCTRHQLPCQRFVMRADLSPGSTIGPMTSANTGIRTIDIGLPMLAMHSVRETAGTVDHDSLIALLQAAYMEGPAVAD
ncbi:MAG: M18 family aminopeptidase [Spirochaetes bacterium GWD1_61_31]|nr:MAG: M18 family aminopeptidase [Spirochaetes bacterium GWB1_60_80]OHD31609.1 MAG: M18 family aminopeptidase [Spirochaetes bacterium GWC1_61_12]OHD40544.1 MAG: M18 family aminopeptidase [Spirochaetes bacterium GWD1_61_31]OHD44045.1 MAG: M18 family aminopeptidase [Spirochaetes bacterium GWE1_60_18]OHD59080.1 MAG: M18 family aminopeptidase [Spirochaetes bacterium GWF1_60_12]HAP44558.1 M18 family aminopeptidase [Spirochaetaceae bacterium]